MNELLKNIDKVHTTPLGLIRIKKNLKLDNIEIIEYSKQIIKESKITKKGKNWYCTYNNIIITVNSYSYTIITAHINRGELWIK